MNKIMELVTENSTYLLLTLGAILIGVVLTFIVNFAARDLKFIKYLPGLALVFIGIISLFMVINKLFDPDSLDNLIIFVIGLSSGYFCTDNWHCKFREESLQEKSKKKIKLYKNKKLKIKRIILLSWAFLCFISVIFFILSL